MVIDKNVEMEFPSGKIAGIFKEAFHYAHEKFHKGVCLEFGVCKGDTYMYQLRYIQDHYKDDKLIGFDSWQGLPHEQNGVWFPPRHAKGNFSSPKSFVLNRMAQFGEGEGDKFRFVDGFFSESLTEDLQKEIQNVIFINIDVDLYISTMQVLDFIKPFLKEGAVVYWDDWNSPGDGKRDGQYGESMAWNQWSAKNADVNCRFINKNHLNQCYMEVV